jgi:trans-aconitate 2-methyltransferase
MAASDTWNPSQYERFKAERAQPFFDLLAMVRVKDNLRVVDLGCGTGELTAQMHRKLNARETVGLDNSSAMLEKAAAFSAPGLTFAQRDIEQFDEKGRFDLVFSNAALHWVENHEALFTRLTAALDEGGQLAVQMPANEKHPSHSVAAELAREEPFAPHVAHLVRQKTLAPEQYEALLDRLGFSSRRVETRIYEHQLDSREQVVEWVKGSTLTDFQRQLSPELFSKFLSEYRARLMAKLPEGSPFTYTFRRLFIWGQR